MRRAEIVTAGWHGVFSYGEDGRLLWQLSGMSSFTVPSPFSAGGLLYDARHAECWLWKSAHPDGVEAVPDRTQSPARRRLRPTSL